MQLIKSEDGAITAEYAIATLAAMRLSTREHRTMGGLVAVARCARKDGFRKLGREFTAGKLSEVSWILDTQTPLSFPQCRNGHLISAFVVSPTVFLGD
ncbi:DUF4244 domain-containing protein [Aquiluna sp.]|nr:DUF4244 domain-containing protein [Aquiluna sp.]